MNRRPAFSVDVRLLEAFEHQFNPARPQASRIPVRSIGYGKVSTVLQLDGLEEVALKRTAPFATEKERAAYQRAVEAYRMILDRLDVGVVEQQCLPMTNPRGEPILYVAQARVAPHTLAPYMLRQVQEDAFELVFRTILEGVLRVWYRNEIDGPDSLIGLDAELSNWSIAVSEEGPVRAVYLDTSLPLIRRARRDLLDPEVFLRVLPTSLAGLLRNDFLELLEQYYDLRFVLTDLVASFRRHDLGEAQPRALALVNTFLAVDAADLEVEPITMEEVQRHYARSSRFWKSFLAYCRLNRFMRTKLLRRGYELVLPDRRRATAP